MVMDTGEVFAWLTFLVVITLLFFIGSAHLCGNGSYKMIFVSSFICLSVREWPKFVGTRGWWISDGVMTFFVILSICGHDFFQPTCFFKW